MFRKSDHKVCAWLDEFDEDLELEDSDDSDADPNFVPGNNNSENESENDDDFGDTDNASEHEFYLSKDEKTKWYKNFLPNKTKQRAHNIVTQRPGVNAVAKNATTILDCWKLFFPDPVIIEMVICTNKYLPKIRAKYQRSTIIPDTDKEEIDALLGLLYLAGFLRSRHVNLKDLWCDEGFRPEYFRSTMSEQQFYILLRALRFDDIETRNYRRTTDKLAPIRSVFDGFIKRCLECYSVGENCTIDEMLEGFRGRCSFRQYIPSKPNKYGIMIQALVDSKTYYTSNMEVYVGTQPDGPFKCDNSPSSIVKRLISTISKTGRNITMDNWYTSIPLAIDLLENHKLTIVGTIRKNKREIPKCFLDTKKREVNSIIFGYGKNIILLSYVPRKNKNVMLISTMHEKGLIDDSTVGKKPEVILYYNSIKSGVDIVDEKKEEYSVARVSCRWSLTVFFSLMNIAELGKELTKNHMTRRLQIPTLSFTLRQNILKLTGFKSNEETTSDVVTSRTKCYFCPTRKNRFTKQTRCSNKTCQSYICKEHTFHICIACTNKEESELDMNNSYSE
ncbi:piggyBac transposable element-derived protein 4-like [Melanaphis sacchari]|uniref:piggyBac transposable element-derived protein 4-like n=1 Tax=Melanaphis sacchari TaxID=742174 RepID=UPI000DC145F7|nr:piggyBac transposable element-derived protein 4-like [Melanaphis sacchari]